MSSEMNNTLKCEKKSIIILDNKPSLHPEFYKQLFIDYPADKELWIEVDTKFMKNKVKNEYTGKHGIDYKAQKIWEIETNLMKQGYHDDNRSNQIDSQSLIRYYYLYPIGEMQCNLSSRDIYFMVKHSDKLPGAITSIERKSTFFRPMEVIYGFNHFCGNEKYIETCKKLGYDCIHEIPVYIDSYTMNSYKNLYKGNINKNAIINELLSIIREKDTNSRNTYHHVIKNPCAKLMIEQNLNMEDIEKDLDIHAEKIRQEYR